MNQTTSIISVAQMKMKVKFDENQANLLKNLLETSGAVP